MLLLLLLTSALASASPLKSTTVYFRYMNNTDFKAGLNVCEMIKPIDEYSFCQKCQITSLINFMVNGTHNAYVFLTLYTVNPHAKSIDELTKYSYTFLSYHMVTARIDKFGQDYLLTSSAQHFIDGTSDKTGNYVHLSLILGFKID